MQEMQASLCHAVLGKRLKSHVGDAQVGKEFCRSICFGCLPGSHHVMVNSRKIWVCLLVLAPVRLGANSLNCMLCSSLNCNMGVRTGPLVQGCGQDERRSSV